MSSVPMRLASKELTTVFSIIFFMMGQNMLAGKGLQEVVPGTNQDKVECFSDFGNAKKIRINVFVHGTYGIATAGLSLYRSLFDLDLKGSVHEKMVRSSYRKQLKALYECSLMYDEGLFRVDPDEFESDLELEGLALIPVLRSFHLANKSIDEKKRPNKKIKDFYYLFGWSGLLSQGARREAGVCLYNSLMHEKSEIEKALKQAGCKAKLEVRLYSHSHGGNVALNLAWVDALSRVESQLELYQAFGQGDHGLGVGSKYGALIPGLPRDWKEAKKKARYDGDKWLYSPKPRNKRKKPLVDELYMLATPIQIETWPLIFSQTFGRIVSLFSAGDTIQNGDVFSTVTRQSEREVSLKDVDKGNRLFSRDGKTKFTQVKIVLPTEQDCPKPIPGFPKEKRVEESIGNFLYKNSLITSSKGPSHLEFWYIYWTGLSERLCIRPAPIVVFTPILDQPWEFGERLKVRFDHSSDGEMLLKKIEPGLKADETVIETCDKDIYQKIKKEFFSRRDVLEENHLIENEALAKVVSLVRRVALFMATS